MAVTADPQIEARYRDLERNFKHWEKIKDSIDQFIDIFENYAQTGHPGGPRSKVHMQVALTLGGFMRWDIRHPEKRFGDKYILVAGHCVPLIYSMLAVYNTALRAKYERTGDPRYAVPHAEERQLVWQDLLGFRRNKGLAGHAEMEGKTLFLKFNTGPSGHGSPPAAGEAIALKRAGATGVKVFAIEGEGGLTTGASHETKNSAYGLGLDNLYYMVDWNDYGIDEFAVSEVVHGEPRTWFEPYGFRVFGTEQGSEFGPVTRALLETMLTPNDEQRPNMTWFKTIKGRGYIVTGYKSHGAPHKLNSDLFWRLRQEYSDKYGTKWEGFGEPAPSDPKALRAQFEANLKAVADTITSDAELVDYLADRLVEIGDSVPDEVDDFRLDTSKNPWHDKRLWDFNNYPKELFVAPGSNVPNRAALAKWGAWANSFGRRYYDRPLFIAMSADLAESTNIAGFAGGFGEEEGYGRYDREHNPEGVLLPQEITEFTNAGISCGIACVNLSPKPFEDFDGFYAACSTYGSFSYLKYGPIRLFSQIVQDSQIKVGKVLWVAGHSGPETAADSRTHFGIFEPAVMNLFPDGLTVTLVPWEHNEVPVVIAAAMATDAHIIGLHLTRPPIPVPDRAALGIASHFEAAKGAYIIRDYKPGQPKMGTILVQGTMSTYNTISILPKLDELGLNVKLVAAISPELFHRQPKSYQDSILSEGDKLDMTYITTLARRLMRDWVTHRISDEYAMTPDWDNRWRTGGTVDEVMEEAHLSPDWILKGIQRFAQERDQRLERVEKQLRAARGS
ncbi:MAG TPA: transketolase [Chloroflexota bacterium]|nr:transketolase [Chloroflexota bacterium]